MRIDTHHGERRDTDGAPDSCNEPARDRVGNEAHRVGETKLPDDEAEGARGDCGDDQRSRCGDEQRVAFGRHGGADERHPDHECRRQSGNRAAIAACERDEQTGGEVAEQHQADSLRRIGSQRSREDEGSEGDLGGQKPQSRGKARRQRRCGLTRQDVRTKLGGEISEQGRHLSHPSEDYRGAASTANAGPHAQQTLNCPVRGPMQGTSSLSCRAILSGRVT